jgi:hypothetical protein
MVDPSQPPRLRVFVRSHGSENRKDRPEFYDKTDCLASLIRAAENLTPSAELVFVNDGPIPPERERLMASAGEILQGDFGSNRQSYRATLAMAARRPSGDADVVWFGEDDYLYTPDAFTCLMEAARHVPQADYLSLYLGELLYREPPDPQDVQVTPRAARTPADRDMVESRVGWTPGVSTTSSFAVRRRILVEDVELLRLMPYTGGAFDHTTLLTLQGKYPFTGRELIDDLLPFRSWPARSWPRAMVRAVVRTTLGTRAFRRPSRRRTLYLPTRDLAAHLELGAFQASEDWESLARESHLWAAERHAESGMPPGPTVGQS